MPTYQYRCAKCGEQFEVWQSIHDDALTTHDDECGGALSKVMGAAGIVLKGSGFYKNDSRSNSKAAKREKREKSESSSSSSSEKKSDSSSSNGSSSGSDKKSDSGKSGSGAKASSGTS